MLYLFLVKIGLFTINAVPLRYNGDSIRTWRNLGGRAKSTSFLATKLVTLATILASFATMLASSKPSGIFQKVVNLSTSFTFNDTSGYISRSFCHAYKMDACQYGEEGFVKAQFPRSTSSVTVRSLD
ncbi:hypothetical protein TNCV_3515951 [Trichonephila clavipes]|nr:hypothetical protein TNCV_3515951 [Trichonephila clavipes]